MLTKQENDFIDNCYKFIINLTKEAGEIVKEGFTDQSKQIDNKQEKWGLDIVTEYDKRVESLFINKISVAYPDHKFIAEESASEHLLTDSPTWIIDPIDGTRNFVHVIPFISISVAFVYKKEIVIGIVSNPVTNEFYRCRKGQGAFLNDQIIRTSTVQRINKAIYAHEVSFMKADYEREKNLKRVLKFAMECEGIRSLGAVAITLAFVARGTFDGYQVDDCKPWDIAAGILLVLEAGGSVYNTDGTAYEFMRPKFVCAGTESLCQELITAIKECDEWTVTINQKI